MKRGGYRTLPGSLKKEINDYVVRLGAYVKGLFLFCFYSFLITAFISISKKSVPVSFPVVGDI